MLPGLTFLLRKIEKPLPANAKLVDGLRAIAKIYYLQFITSERFSVPHQDILCFKVAVNNAFRVDKHYAAHDLVDVGPGHLQLG